MTPPTRSPGSTPATAADQYLAPIAGMLMLAGIATIIATLVLNPVVNLPVIPLLIIGTVMAAIPVLINYAPLIIFTLVVGPLIPILFLYHLIKSPGQPTRNNSKEETATPDPGQERRLEHATRTEHYQEPDQQTR